MSGIIPIPGAQDIYAECIENLKLELQKIPNLSNDTVTATSLSEDFEDKCTLDI